MCGPSLTHLAHFFLWIGQSTKNLLKPTNPSWKPTLRTTFKTVKSPSRKKKSYLPSFSYKYYPHFSFFHWGQKQSTNYQNHPRSFQAWSSLNPEAIKHFISPQKLHPLHTILNLLQGGPKKKQRIHPLQPQLQEPWTQDEQKVQVEIHFIFLCKSPIYIY